MRRVLLCLLNVTNNDAKYRAKVTQSCAYFSSTSPYCQDQPVQDRHIEEHERHSSTGPATRIHKLIASQSDPLLAKEIFDLASRHPDFQPSYAVFHSLIIKLGRAHHFSLMEPLLHSLKYHRFTISPSLFSHIIQIYGDAGNPEKALKTFYTILEFNMKPRRRHLNQILEILVAHRDFIRPAFDLFKSAHRYGVPPNTRSYNILMRAFCLNDDLSIACSLLDKMYERDVLPDVESYRILIQGLCRKSQVNKAVDLLDDMLNKGFVPDTFCYTTLLNSLCRKKQLREAYKLLCRMKVKGCNPDIVHYNTVILGFCREGRALDACKVLEEMPENGCLPNLVSYRTLVGGLCDQGMYEKAKDYVNEMVSKGFSLHFSRVHTLIMGFCGLGKIDEACEIVEVLLKHQNTLHIDTWDGIIGRVCEDDAERLGDILEEIKKVEIKPGSRIVDIGAGFGDFIINRIKGRSRKV
ncbi:hypothetical protein DM860_003662 [Cuscuta australis]|uniref:Pentacotripeptide-repeat region of PRORP domain-containing protein n=1 Tax=Cuscuta australis TaxID=267555 RepID=A0A328DLL5_9ASTE|nr:hypothetical protein DM860_003662 [Cuscuta australis]